MFAEINRRTLAFRGGGLVTPAAAASAAGTEAWERQDPEGLNGRGADEEAELEGLEAEELEATTAEEKELLLPQDAASPPAASGPISDDEEDGEGGSLGDGSGAEGGSCSSSRRSGGDGGDEAEGSGEGESIRHFPLARPKSLLQKLHISFQGSWLKEFPWLYYCQETGLMSCAWCTAAAAAAAPPELIMSGAPLPGGHDELCKGTRNYKRTLLLRHHLSAEHRLNEPGSAEQVFLCSLCMNFFKWLLVVVAWRAGRAALLSLAASGAGDEPALEFGVTLPLDVDRHTNTAQLFVAVLRSRYPSGADGSSVYLVKINRRCGKKVAYESQCHSTDLNTLVTTSSCGTGGGRAVSGQRPLVKWGLGGEAELPSELNNEGYCDFNSRPNENSYCYQLLQELNEQRKKGILCDVNIVVSGRVFRAHKNILVAGSRFFKTLYCFTNKESRNQTTVTYLDVVAVQGFSVILDFLYSGNLVLTSQNAIEVMSVASYLQMTEVVQSCRNFIKDALNISIKSEAPETVVVDYNRRSVSRDGLSPRDQKVASFWATRNLTNLASSIKTENDPYPIDEGQMESYQMNDCSWVQDSSPEMAENESQGEGKVFVWNDMGAQGQSVQEPGKARRKNQTAKRFIYNIPPNTEENSEDCSVLQPSVPYPEEDLSFIKEEAATSSDFKYGLLPGTSNDFKYGLLPGTSSDFKYGLLPGTSSDFKYGLLPESWPKETWENGDSSALIMNKLKCPHCNYVAKYRRTLKRHLLIHTGVRSFSCDICGKLFTRREHVKRHSLVHKKDKKYKCMVCKKIFMLAASVGIRHGSRRYGVCVDCADKSQPGGQEGADQVQDTDFPRDEEYEENEVGEGDEELGDDVEEQNDQSRWDEGGEVCMPLDD
ncbi:hypothetical protein Nmel_001277 [Mimus melanotis]